MSLSKLQFFNLMNLVLEDSNRSPMSLQSSQWRSIEILPDEQVLQILAGPGSGKTETLVWRVLYELFVIGTEASKIIVTTFTNRASEELQIRLVERSDKFLKFAHQENITIDDPKIYDLYMGTIHSLCDQLLSEYDEKYIEDGIQLIDETENVVRMMRSHRYTIGNVEETLAGDRRLLSLFRAPWLTEVQWPNSNVHKSKYMIELASQHIETWIPRCEASGLKHGLEGYSPNITNKLIELQSNWEEYLAQQHILDFATIQKHFLERQDELFREHFTHVFVDEFQDNNPIQFMIHTSWLASSNCRLTVVGDDDQAIYRFRGSDIGCFNDLKPFCDSKEIVYRQEKLEVNYRSSKNIVQFCQRYKSSSVLSTLSMPKHVQADSNADNGLSVRYLEGPWENQCNVIAGEIDAIEDSDSVAVLMYSTSEKSNKPALSLRMALESIGQKVYNPRSKMAASPDSPVGMLLGLISYLIDPISSEPVGKNNGYLEVHAYHESGVGKTARDNMQINSAHLTFQKKFLKGRESRKRLHKVTIPQEKLELLSYIDTIRSKLLEVCKSGERPSLTLAGFVARLLAQPFFRDSGFTLDMFRQALFTQLLEANIAPTRLTMSPLDAPLEVNTNSQNKYIWDKKFWMFLNVFGAYLVNTSMDDLEVEAFEENAIPLITFHQSKGLEFDHIYVAGVGRNIDLGPALRTRLFSGERVDFTVEGGQPITDSQPILELAQADKEREIYVALTRAKKSITILQPNDLEHAMSINPILENIFSGFNPSVHVLDETVSVKEWKND